jgi:hypothetical protein
LNPNLRAEIQFADKRVSHSLFYMGHMRVWFWELAAMFPAVQANRVMVKIVTLKSLTEYAARDETFMSCWCMVQPHF